MKPESKLTALYADLLDEASDDSLNELVRELDRAYTAPERPVGLTWSASHRKRLAPVSSHNPNTATRLPIRPRTKRARKVAFLAVAAVVALALLTTALLATIGASRFQRGQQGQISVSSLDALLLQGLLQSQGTPANIRQLALSGQFTKIHLTSQTGHITIQQAYADANNVVLIYTVDQSTWNASMSCTLSKVDRCISEPVLTLTTSDKRTLKENFERVNMGPEPVYKNQQVAILAYYDASSIQEFAGQLHLTASQEMVGQLHLTVSLSKRVSPSGGRVGELVVPFHTEKTVINVNQTVTVHEDALTLVRAVITPTEARFYNAGMSDSKLNGLGLFPTRLSIAGTNYDSNPFPASNESNGNTYGWFGQRSSNFVGFYDTLRSQRGTWILTEWGRIWTDGSFDHSHADNWTFTFTVS